MRGAYEGFFVQAIVGYTATPMLAVIIGSSRFIGESVRNPPGDSMTRLAKKSVNFSLCS
jgi:hypothetical protein